MTQDHVVRQIPGYQSQSTRVAWFESPDASRNLLKDVRSFHEISNVDHPSEDFKIGALTVSSASTEDKV